MQTPDRGCPGRRRSGQHLRRSDSRCVAIAIFLAAGCFASNGHDSLLQVRVTQGDGVVHTAGSRLWRPIVLQVTDETGNPVTGARVGVRLPDDGATGLFSNGLSSDVIATDAAGRAEIRAIRFGRTSGQVQIRITAAAGNARAGTLCIQFIAPLRVK